jgi:hypothetical protein
MISFFKRGAAMWFRKIPKNDKRCRLFSLYGFTLMATCPGFYYLCMHHEDHFLIWIIPVVFTFFGFQIATTRTERTEGKDIIQDYIYRIILIAAPILGMSCFFLMIIIIMRYWQAD